MRAGSFSYQRIGRSVGFGAECLGQHAGDPQSANLGDGNGQGKCSVHRATCASLTPPAVNETSELRWDYGDPELGTCQETIKGGNHFRYWVQDGSQANRFVSRHPQCLHVLTGRSGAYFMATSYELPIQSKLLLFCPHD